MSQSPLPHSDDSPCTRCGACCAHFRVSFYWAEAAERGLPEALYEPLTPVMAYMRGTQSKSPRCAALVGEIGQRVTCSVYEQRTSPCRELQPGDEKCNKARAKHGLPALVTPAKERHPRERGGEGGNDGQGRGQ